MSAKDHSEKYYVKVWGVLVVLLIVSVVGPEFGIPWLTLLTAFGIAFVKANLVIKKFMHLGEELAYVRYFLITAIVFIMLFFVAVAPDVLNHHGAAFEVGTGPNKTIVYQWNNIAAKSEIERAKKEASSGGHGHD